MRPPSPAATAPMRPLSAAIINIIEPYSHAADPLRDYKALAGLATLAWNLALMPEAEREALLAEIVHQMGTLDGVAVREIIQTLSRRKNILCTYDQRLILGCEVAMTPNGYHVMVMSARNAVA